MAVTHAKKNMKRKEKKEETVSLPVCNVHQLSLLAYSLIQRSTHHQISQNQEIQKNYWWSLESSKSLHLTFPPAYQNDQINKCKILEQESYERILIPVLFKDILSKTWKKLTQSHKRKEPSHQRNKINWVKGHTPFPIHPNLTYLKFNINHV